MRGKKKALGSLLVSLAFIGVPDAYGSAFPVLPDANCNYVAADGDTTTVRLRITGMSCGGCAGHISAELSKLDGILEQEVSYPQNSAIVKYDPKEISEADIITAIEKAGYKATAFNNNR